MSKAAKHGAFISYARRDGKEYAASLRERLQRDISGMRLWQDLTDIEGGQGWWRQIEEALGSVEFLLMVMTPGALQSEITFKEWRFAKQQGVSIYPIQGPGYDFSDPRIPKWVSKAHCYNLDEQWDIFVEHLRRGGSALKTPFMAPNLPTHFVPRPAEFDQLKSLLLDRNRVAPVAVTTALKGAGGFGKTVLATALCHDDDILTAFDDGILWTTLGQQPLVADGLAKLYAGLTGERPAFKDVEDAAVALAERLQNKNCLIVIDDVWAPQHVQPFLRGGPGCARLITTRASEVAIETNARRVHVDQMTTREATALLVNRLGGMPDDPEILENLAHRLGEWPLLLKLASSALAQRMGRGESLRNAASYALTALDRANVTAFDRRSDTDRHAAIATAIQASLSLLDPSEELRYLRLAIFPEDEAIPIRVVAELWATDEFEAQALVLRLDDVSLLEFDFASACITIHDVLRAYLETRLGPAELAKSHSMLVDRWGANHHDLPHVYAWRWFGYHMERAGRQSELRELLIDLHWLRQKIEQTEIVSLLREFEHVTPCALTLLIRDTLQLSSHILIRDKAALAHQLLARIPEQHTIRAKILSQALECKEPWLLPLIPQLSSAGGPLLRTLAGHADDVHALSLSADNRRALSASDDHTLRLWDLDTGTELRTFEGKSGFCAVAFTAYERHAWSLTSDDWLLLWDLRAGKVVRRLNDGIVKIAKNGKRGIRYSEDRVPELIDLLARRKVAELISAAKSATPLALTPDGNRAVLRSDDGRMHFWDINRGSAQRVSSDAYVETVAISSDGERVLASCENLLTLWEFNTARLLRSYPCSPDVTLVALDRTGKRAVIADDRLSLQFWNLDDGSASSVSRTHSSSIHDIQLTDDGSRAITASADRTIKIWSFDRERLASDVEGDTSEITAIVISPDDGYAICSSSSGTYKVWNLRNGSEVRGLRRHRDHDRRARVLWTDGVDILTSDSGYSVNEWKLADPSQVRQVGAGTEPIEFLHIGPERRMAMSVDVDGPITITDLDSGKLLRTLVGHESEVMGLVLSPDGNHLLSGGEDGTARLWNVSTGRALFNLFGDGGIIYAVAMTPDLRFAVTGAEAGTLLFWNLSPGSKEGVRLSGHSDSICHVALLQNGRRVVSASEDRSVRVWDVESRSVIASFWSDSAITACAVAADEKTIVAGDAHGRVHVLQLIAPSDA